MDDTGWIGGASIYGPVGTGELYTVYQGGGLPTFAEINTVFGNVAGTAGNVLKLTTDFTVNRLLAEARIAEARAALERPSLTTLLMLGIAAVGLYFTVKGA